MKEEKQLHEVTLAKVHYSVTLSVKPTLIAHYDAIII